LFTVEQRDALRVRMLQLAEEDARVVAGAAVGSLAVETATASPTWTSPSGSQTTRPLRTFSTTGPADSPTT
jgi:hypothetical protein